MKLLKQDEKLGRFTCSLYICRTKAMTALVQWLPTGGPQAFFLVGHGATAHFGMFKFTE